MKKFYLISAFLFLFYSDNIFAQAALDTANTWPQNAEDRSQTDNRVFTMVEQMPEFPGGNDSLQSFLRRNIKYPADAKQNQISGKVYVTFVVDQMGKVKEAKVLRGIGGGCDEEALRVVKMLPDWTPGKQNGKTVNVQYNIPIHFNL